VGWSSAGSWLASSEWENIIRLWEPVAGASLQILQHPDDSGNVFYSLAWSPDGQRLAAGTNRRGVQVFDMIAQRQRWSGHVFPTWIRHVAWRPDGAQLAGGGDDGTVYIWDAADGRLLQQLAGHHSMVTRVAWSPNGRRLVSGSGGSDAGELFVWDAQRGERLRAFAGHQGIVYAVAWGATEDIVISGGGGGRLRWWDVRSGMCVLVREAHQGTIQSLRRSPDGAKLASCGDDGAIMLWNIHTGEHPQTLRRDRPYERMNIAGLAGITEAQRASLLVLGAVDEMADTLPAAGDTQTRAAAAAEPAVLPQTTPSDRSVAIGLPFQPTPFIGRGSEIAQISTILAYPHCRLLTLLGPGGIGKTRLALAIAAGHTATFRDGAAFVELASITTPTQIVTAIGETLSITLAGQADPTAQLLGELRDRHMLLVLDNFEHLLAGADLVSDILEGAPQVTMLITSRERLNLQVEWLFDVAGLDYPPEASPGSMPAQHLADPAGYSAIQLFVQRARQIQPSFSLSEPTLATIVQICQQVAGMPLAIELAAAGLRTLPVAMIERQIRTNLDVLATTGRDVPARHRSLRAVFDHSWNLLSEPERTLFSCLAVFRGGWTADAAAAVLSFEFKVLSLAQKDPELRTQNSELLPLLAALVDKSLVRQDSVEQSSSAERDMSNIAATSRYVMLEPLREYALERLDARPDAQAVRQRHAHYFTALAETAAAEWDTPLINAAIAQQRREQDNLRAALQWACDSGDSLVGLRLAWALWGFWRSYGSIGEGRAWLEQLLRLDAHPADPAAMAARQRGLHAAAWLASDQHDYTTATWLFEERAALRRALGETAGETDLLLNAARRERAAGNYQQATTLLEDALSRHRRLNSQAIQSDTRSELSFHELGQILRELGLVLRERGDFTRAVALLEEALTLYRAIDDRVSMALALLGLGDVARDRGDGAAVREYGEPCLAIFRESDMQWAIGFGLNTLALGAYYEGDLARAFGLIEESVALFRGLKSDASLAEVLITRGKIVRAQADTAMANAAMNEALRLAQVVGPRLLVAASMEGLAGLLAAQGHAQLAVRLLAAAAALRAQMGAPVRPADQADLEHALATARAALGDDTFAAVWAEAQALPLDQVLGAIQA
jgi:predicted ATPase/tetratricopeptide (TPR) repeat protein